jgi:hypothetical protein
VSHVVSVHVSIPTSVTNDPKEAAAFALAYLREQRELRLDVKNAAGDYCGTYDSYEFETGGEVSDGVQELAQEGRKASASP